MSTVELDSEQMVRRLRIVAGSTEGGRPLPPTEAAARRDRFRENGAHDRRVATGCSRRGEHRVAAKKGWSAFANAIQAACAAEGVLVTWERDIVRVAVNLASLVREVDSAAGDTLLHGFMTARRLNLHFHENDLPPDMVEPLVGEVMDAVDLLDSAFGDAG